MLTNSGIPWLLFIEGSKILDKTKKERGCKK